MSELLTYKGYYGTVHYSAEDEVFYGKVHAINDLVNFEGSSVDELKSAFQESVDDYLQTCEELGKKPNKTFKGSFNVRISPELHQRAAVYAQENSISLNELIKRAIARLVGGNEDLGDGSLA